MITYSQMIMAISDITTNFCSITLSDTSSINVSSVNEPSGNAGTYSIVGTTFASFLAYAMHYEQAMVGQIVEVTYDDYGYICTINIMPDSIGALALIDVKNNIPKFQFDPSDQSPAAASNESSAGPSDDRNQVIGENRNSDGSLIADMLRLGDVQFKIAPSQITVTDRYSGDKIPIIAGKSSMFSSTGHSETQVEMTIYFNTLDQINGVDAVCTLPNGSNITYSVNGIRALLAEFKRCPFLPVENDYLNNVCDIYAVALSDLSLSTVENFPGLMCIDLTCYVFDHLAYLPSLYNTTFGTAFNWPMFRWYYQQALVQDPSHPDHTYLQPMTGLASDFMFSVINQQYLAEKKAATDYVNSHKAPTTYTFQNLNASLQKQGLPELNYDERSLQDYFAYSDAVNQFENDILPQLRIYQLTGKESDNPANKFYSYWSSDNGGCLEISISGAANVDAICAPQYNSHVILGLTPGMGINIGYAKIWFKPPELSGSTSADVAIGDIIRRNAFTDTVTHQYSSAIAAAWDSNYTTYYAMFAQSELEPQETGNFDDYPMDGVICTFMSATFNNILVPIQTQMCPTPTYQHLGSQDILITMKLETVDATSAQTLLGMFQRASMLVREYKLYLDTGFIKLTNGLVQLFGVNYVVPIQVTPATTTEPGHYAIELILMNYDRYQRELATANEIATDKVIDYSDPNHAQLEILNGQKVVQSLQYCEMRPDLELPNKIELALAGFHVDVSGYFADPDFYIDVRSTSISEIIDDVFQNELVATTTDPYGGVMKVASPIVTNGVAGPMGNPTYNNVATGMNSDGQAAVSSNAAAYVTYYGENPDGSTVSPDNGAGAAVQALTPSIPSTGVDDTGNPTTAGFNVMFKTMADKYNIPIGMLQAIAAHETGTQQFWSGTSTPICTSGNGRHLKAADINDASIATCTGVGIMQNNCTQQSPSIVHKIAYDTQYNIELGALCLVKHYQMVVKAGATIPSAFDQNLGMWIAAYYSYEGYPADYWNSSNTKDQDKLDTLYSLYDPNTKSGFKGFGYYCNGAAAGVPSLGTGTADPTSSSGAVAEDDVSTYYTAVNADAGAPIPADNGDLFYRSTEDMRVTDCRGRMVRAFPAFLLVLVDEGAYINAYKLHDNFYSYFAISEMHVNKSRKIAGDTATLTFINVFQTLDTSPYDAFEYAVDDWTAIIDDISSLFVAPLAQLEEERNQTFDRLCLCAGARVHLRIGYGSDATQFPIQMNGCITEIGSGENIDVIIQGDGIELTSKIPWPPGTTTNRGGYLGSLLATGDTPRHLLYTLLTLRGSWWNSLLHRIDAKIYSFFSSQSPMGIAHFGDLGEDMLFFTNTAAEANSEIMQNIYPGNNLATISTTPSSSSQTPAVGFTMGVPVFDKVSATWNLSATIVGNANIPFKTFGFLYGDSIPDMTSQVFNLASTGLTSNGVTITGSFNGSINDVYYFSAYITDSTDTAIVSNIISSLSSANTVPVAPTSIIVGAKGEVPDTSGQSNTTVTPGTSEQSFETTIFDKSVWDVAQIMAASVPDFITAVHPFGFRSTLFYGKPYYDLIYDYDTIDVTDNTGNVLTKAQINSISDPAADANTYSSGPTIDRIGQTVAQIKSDNAVEEGTATTDAPAKTMIKFNPKVKPYRQYHIFSSDYDLLNSNNLIASDKNMHTCVIGMYTDNSNNPQTTSPVYLDINIYPEKMKTDIVDTSLASGATLFKGWPILGWVVNSVNWIEKITGGAGTTVANTIATSALKLDVQEMYQGSFTIFGDPSVKPYDSFYLMDTYNNMSGMADVRAVTHHLTLTTGFVSTIEPDVSIVMADPYMSQSWGLFGNVACAVFMKLAMTSIGKFFKYNGSTPALAAILNAARYGKSNLLKAITSIGKTAGADDIDIAMVTKTANDISDIAGKGNVLGSLSTFLPKLSNVIRGVGASGVAATEGDAAIGEIVVGGPIGLALVAIEFIGLTILSASVGTLLTRWLANRMALKICLLKKNGHEFAAGIDGHRGCVVGDAGDALTTMLQTSWGQDLAQLFGVSTIGSMPAYNALDGVTPLDPSEMLSDINDAMVDISSTTGNGSGYQTPAPQGSDSGARAHVNLTYFKSQNDTSLATLQQVLATDGAIGPTWIKMDKWQSASSINLNLCDQTLANPWIRKATWDVLQNVGREFTTQIGATQPSWYSVLTLSSAWRGYGDTSHETGYAVDLPLPIAWQVPQDGGLWYGKTYPKPTTSLSKSANDQARQWVDTLVSILINNGALEILVGYTDVLGNMTQTYPTADIHILLPAHLTHVHCMLGLPSNIPTS